MERTLAARTVDWSSGGCEPREDSMAFTSASRGTLPHSSSAREVWLVR